ncbi:hypothetical protein ABIE69_002948 [Rhodobacteraceae bacterium MBR-64]
MTPLDTAYAAMAAASEDDAARLRYYGEVCGALLFVLLEREVTGAEAPTPRSFSVDGTSYVLAFDTEERLADFASGPAPYAEVPGRRIAELLAGDGATGLAINLGAASGNLLPPEVVAWLVETFVAKPAVTEAQVAEVTVPRGLPEALITALDRTLARAAGLAQAAVLAGVRYHGAGRGHLLVVIDAAAGAQEALARAVSEALVFSGVEAGAIDVVFVPADAPLALRAGRVGLRFDLPQPEAASPQPPPGSNPNKPPILR